MPPTLAIARFRPLRLGLLSFCFFVARSVLRSRPAFVATYLLALGSWLDTLRAALLGLNALGIGRPVRIGALNWLRPGFRRGPLDHGRPVRVGALNWLWPGIRRLIGLRTARWCRPGGRCLIGLDAAGRFNGTSNGRRGTRYGRLGTRHGHLASQVRQSRIIERPAWILGERLLARRKRNGGGRRHRPCHHGMRQNGFARPWNGSHVIRRMPHHTFAAGRYRGCHANYLGRGYCL